MNDVDAVGLEIADTACSEIADYPIGMYGAISALINGIIRVCGGSDINSCYAYTYEPAGGWERQ